MFEVLGKHCVLEANLSDSKVTDISTGEHMGRLSKRGKHTETEEDRERIMLQLLMVENAGCNVATQAAACALLTISTTENDKPSCVQQMMSLQGQQRYTYER